MEEPGRDIEHELHGTVEFELQRADFRFIRRVRRQCTAPVWMPPLMQADSWVGWGHAIRCGRVSGLMMRPFIAAGLYGDMRIASLSGLRAGRRSGRFRFSRSRLVDRCPLPSFDLLTSPAHPPAAGSGGGGSPVSRLADGQRPDDPGHLVGESDDNNHARLFRHHHPGEP
jgi:hypothetical protein